MDLNFLEGLFKAIKFWVFILGIIFGFLSVFGIWKIIELISWPSKNLKKATH